MRLINVLPWRVVLAQQQRKKTFVQLLASIIIIVLFTSAARFYLGYKIQRAQQQLQQLQTLSKTHAAQQSTLNGQQQQLQELAKQTQELELLDSKRRSLPQLLELLANQLPPELYLTALQQKEGVLQIEGRAANQQTITQFMTLLTAMPEFSQAQLQLAKEIVTTKQFEFVIQIAPPTPQQDTAHATE